MCLLGPLRSARAQNTATAAAAGAVDVSKQPVAMITGSARGLGLEIAKGFLAKGYRVIFAARNRPPEEFLSDTSRTFYVGLDLLDQDKIASAAAAATQKWGHVDVLVNNAGLITVGDAVSQSTDKLHEVMQTNFMGPTELTQKILQKNLAGENPLKIIYISSAGGIVHHPFFSAYGSSRAAAEAYFATLRSELRNNPGYSVNVVRPAFIRSDYAVTVNAAEGMQPRQIDKMAALRSFSPTTSDDVVQSVLRVAEKPSSSSFLTNVGIDGKGTALAALVLPRKVFDGVQSVTEDLAGKIMDHPSCALLLANATLKMGHLTKLEKAGLAGLVGLGAIKAVQMHGRDKADNFVDHGAETGMYLYDFTQGMDQRAQEISAGHAIVKEKYDDKKVAESPPSPKCDGVYSGNMNIESNLQAFPQVWKWMLSNGFGSPNDRQYRTFASAMSMRAQQTPYLEHLKATSNDQFQVRFDHGHMIAMDEVITTRQWGAPVSVTRWSYRPEPGSTMYNSVERMMNGADCDPKAVAAHYNEVFDAQKFRKGIDSKVTFTINKSDGSIAPLLVPQSKPYDHRIEYFPSEVPAATNF